MSLTSLRTDTLPRWRALTLALFAALAFTLVAALPARADGDPTEDIVRNVDIAVQIDASGIAHVTETYTWDFGDRNGLGFYRSLVQYAGWEPDPDLMRQYVYSNFEVSSPSGAPAEVWVEDEYGTLLILSVGAPDGSSDTRTGVQTYVLTYDIEGSLNAITDTSGDPAQEEFFWNPLEDWDNDIEKATVAITGPADVVDLACYAGPFGSDEPCTSYTSQGGTATLVQDGIPAGEGFTVMAAYPPGTFAETDPMLVDNSFVDDGDDWDSGGWTGGTSTANPVPSWIANQWPWLAAAWTAVLGAIGFRRYKKGRDLHYVGLAPNNLPPAGMEDQYQVEPLTSEPPVTVQFQPPAGMSPAEAGVLIEETANPNHITATIVDLAARGYLTIEETGQTLFGKPKDWRLSRVPNPPSGADLRPYEADLLRDLFSGRASVEISDLSGSFASKVSKYRKSLTQISDSNGWYTRKGLVGGSSGGSTSPRRIMTIAFFTIWLLMFMGGGSMVMLAGGGSTFVVVAGLLVAVISLVVVLAATAKMAHARSAKGRALYEQVRGFKQYISTAEAHQLKWEQGEDIFSKYLPWAMVFGCADRWAKMFEQLAAEGIYTTMPVWYVSSRPFSPASFSAMGTSMTTFASAAPSTLSYTPGSSGGSGSFGGGGFGGGGGFSGGGGFGGGGGGR